jgi:hypothetical protein
MAEGPGIDPLPEGWTAYQDAEGRIFYANAVGETTWERPQAPLPNGWGAYQDAEGRTYYANPLTGETSWTCPASAALSTAVDGISEEELLGLVDRITEERFMDFVDDFAEENAQYFGPGPSGEHRLLDTEIHEKYKRLFESRAEAWLRERGHSCEALLVAAASSEGLAQDIAEQLLAVSDFSTFASMMRARRERQEAEATSSKKDRLP